MGLYEENQYNRWRKVKMPPLTTTEELGIEEDRIEEMIALGELWILSVTKRDDEEQEKRWTTQRS